MPGASRFAWDFALTGNLMLFQPVVCEFDQLQRPKVLLLGLHDCTAIGRNLVDAELTEWARPVLERALGEDNVINREGEMGAEDFAHFAQQYPGFYFRLGVEHPDHPSGDVHTPTFRADDAAVPVGIRAMSSLVVNYLRDHAGQ